MVKLVQLAIILCVAMFLLVPAAMADPARPGLDSASSAVYSQPGAGGSLDEVDRSAPAQGGQGGEESGSPAGADTGSAGSGDSDKLPFTGLSALLVLGVGLGALLVGLVLRVAARRPTQA